MKGVKAEELKRKGGEYPKDATISSSRSQDAGNNRVISGLYADISNMIPKSSRWVNSVTSGNNKRRESYIGITKDWSRSISQYFPGAGGIHNTNCTNCKDCTDCDSCTNCSNCTDCEDCAGLYGARGLKGVRASRLSWFGGYRISITTSDGRREDMSGFSFNLSWDPFDHVGQSVGADSGLVQVNDQLYFNGQRMNMNDGWTRAGRSLRRFLKRLIIVGGLVVLMVWRSRREARDEKTKVEDRGKDERTRRHRRT